MTSRSSPNRGRAVGLQRHEIDAVARAIAAGRRGLGARLDGVADAIAARISAKLAAAGVEPNGRPARVDVDRETRLLIVARVAKHLSVRKDATTNGSPLSR